MSMERAEEARMEVEEARIKVEKARIEAHKAQKLAFDLLCELTESASSRCDQTDP